MNISKWVAATTARLSAAGIGTARLDALVLLEDCTGRNRALLLAHPESVLEPAQLSALEQQIERRVTHEPLAYIRGKAEFYGRDFTVNKNVLQPRPESETIIDMLLALPAAASATIIDVGTGSGALAITASLELPASRVIATDISQDCLDVARCNAARMGARLEYIQGDLVQPLAGEQLAGSILLCNLPYVPSGYAVNRAASHEPPLALYGGHDGLDCYSQLFAQLAGRGERPAHILTESLPQQHLALSAIAHDAGYAQRRADGLIQLFS